MTKSPARGRASRARPQAASSGDRLLGAVVLGCLVVVAWGWILDLSWTGIDALPLVDASRIASPADAYGVLTQEYRAGVGSGAFYRPVSSLTYAIDYALWGLDPSAFHRVDLLLHLLNALLLVELLSQGLGPRSRSAALVAASLFLVHPALIDTVPAIARRSDVLATTFFLASLLAVDRSWRTRGSARAGWSAAAMIAALLAWGSKEVAFALPVAIAAMAVARGGGTVLERLRRGTRRAIPFALLFVLTLSARFVVLGGIGGYSPRASQLTDPFALLARMAAHSRGVAHDMFDHARVLTHPVAILHGEGMARELVLGGAALAIVALASWLVWREVRSIGRAAGGGESAGAARDALAAARAAVFDECLFLTGWLAAVTMIFAASNTYHSWYGYLPAAAASGLLVSFGRGALLVWRGADAPGVPSRASAAVVGVASMASATALVLASPLLRDYPEWRAVSDATERVLQEVDRLAPDWETTDQLYLVGLPCHVERTPDYPFRAQSAAGLWDYSVEAYVRLRSLGGTDGLQLTGLVYTHPSPDSASEYSLRTGVAPGWRVRLDATPPDVLEPPPRWRKPPLPDGRRVWQSDDFWEALSRPGAPPLMDIRLAGPTNGRASPRLWLFEATGSRILAAWDPSGEPAPQLSLD